jgi:hypothetical protein
MSFDGPNIDRGELCIDEVVNVDFILLVIIIRFYFRAARESIYSRVFSPGDVADVKIK